MSIKLDTNKLVADDNAEALVSTVSANAVCDGIAGTRIIQFIAQEAEAGEWSGYSDDHCDYHDCDRG